MEASDEIGFELTLSPGDQDVRFDYIARCDGEVAFSGCEQRVCARTAAAGQ